MSEELKRLLRSRHFWLGVTDAYIFMCLLGIVAALIYARFWL